MLYEVITDQGVYEIDEFDCASIFVIVGKERALVVITSYSIHYTKLYDHTEGFLRRIPFKGSLRPTRDHILAESSGHSHNGLRRRRSL